MQNGRRKRRPALPSSILHSAFCLLPSAFCLLPSAFCLLPSAVVRHGRLCYVPSCSRGVAPVARLTPVLRRKSMRGMLTVRAALLGLTLTGLTAFAQSQTPTQPATTTPAAP